MKEVQHGHTQVLTKYDQRQEGFPKENPHQPGIVTAHLLLQNTIWLCHQGTPIVSFKKIF